MKANVNKKIRFFNLKDKVDEVREHVNPNFVITFRRKFYYNLVCSFFDVVVVVEKRESLILTSLRPLLMQASDVCSKKTCRVTNLG